MRFPRAAFIALACSAVVVVCASFVSVRASPCLSSASAVRREHPRAWPSWTLRGRGHQGVKCWYPATPTTARNHRHEMALKKNSVEARKLQSTLGGNSRSGSSSIPLAETNELGWPLATSARQIGTTPIAGTSSFADRFAVAVRQDGRRQSPLIQIMIDPIGGAKVPFVTDAGVASWIPTDKEHTAGKLVPVDPSMATRGDKPAPLDLRMIEDRLTNDGDSASGETIRVDPPLAANQDKPSVIHEFLWGAKQAACRFWAKLCGDEN